MLLALVGALDVWLGLHWPRPIAVAKSTARTKNVAAVQPTRRRWQTEFWRFVWQTVRQSWKTGFGAICLGLALTSMFSVITGIANFSAGLQLTPFLSMLFAPALLGAVVFREDQRGRQYRFISERFGRPRTLWLARQAVWIGLLAIACAGLSLVIWLLLDYSHFQRLSWSTESWQRAHFMDRTSIEFVQLESWLAIRFALELLSLTWFSIFTAYAVGQLFSITVRSSVLAGMLALIASTMVSAWAMVLVAWRLPALWFMAPIGVLVLLASWLYVKDWLFDRTRVRTGLIHLGLVFAPVIVLPFMRPHWRSSSRRKSSDAVSAGVGTNVLRPDRRLYRPTKHRS